MNKPKFNIDAHAYWLLCEGQQVEVDGQKIQLTIVEEVKKTIDLHTDSWAVYNDGSQRFQDTVVKWIKENKEVNLTGSLSGCFYGITKYNRKGPSVNSFDFTHILTIDEFCALAYPEKEEGSELVGKWLRYKKEGFDITNKWFEIKNVEPTLGLYANSVNALTINGEAAPYGDYCFDLSNPLDYNPETLIGKYLRGHQITSLEIHATNNYPIFRTKESNGNYWVACKDITPSDVTDTPPIKSLKYEDCFERVKPVWFVDTLGKVKTYHSIREDGVKTERQAKQLAATIKLMTIMHDANGGEWVPNQDEKRVIVAWNPAFGKGSEFFCYTHTNSFYSPIYFRDYETAQRAYEENKEIFHDYFGIGGENE